MFFAHHEIILSFGSHDYCGVKVLKEIDQENYVLAM
jgi:hypothetical protein